MGGRVGEVAARLNWPLMPWQQYVADVALELDDGGGFVYDGIGLVVGRQEGKTALKFAVAVHRLVAMVETHGPQRVTYTMQDRNRAKIRLERDYAARLRRARGFREIEAKSRVRPSRRTEWRLGMNSGAENIQFGPDSFLQIDTPSRTGGHGDTLDLGLIDEAFAHRDNTVENNMEPAMLTRRDAQLWVLSAGGDGTSSYLWRKVLAGRESHAPDSGIAYFEWSAEDDADPSDRNVWAACSPALGFTVPEAAIARRWEKALLGGQEAIDKFRRSYLSQWPEIPILDTDLKYRVIPAHLWQACERVGHRPSGRLSYAVDVDVNARGEEWAAVACSDGTHVELVTPLDAGPGTGWVVPKIVANGLTEITVDPNGPAGKLIAAIETAGVTVRKIKPAEFAQASGQFVDAVTAGLIRHIDQPALNLAVAGANKRDAGDGAWKWTRKGSSVDICPLVAVTLARWAAGTDDGPSAYESRGLAMLG